MLAPISWLKEYVDIEVSPEELADKLVSIGFEVEEIIYQNRRASDVVVGKIIAVEKHPNADKLRVTKIDVGGKILNVVTNVPVIGGEIIAVALDGARLADGTVIKTGALRGVVSEGMLCGLEEVGVEAFEVDGQVKGDILRFDESVRLGTPALDALGLDDVILDVGVTANRPDCNSIYKLAREVAVALGISCKNPEIDYKTVGENVREVVKVTIKNRELCPRYMAAAVKNVKIFPSSDVIKKRLRGVGIRPINNMVDITNYVLMEIGQPMHAFDRRDIAGGEIIVRNAEQNEKLVTLNDKENNLDPSMLVICDAEKPCAVAGIMGGLNSGVKYDTSEIVFESAKFARDNIRRTSRTLNLRSDSSARFEKGIDFASQELAIKRALTLVYKSGSADIVDGIIDEAVDFEKTREIEFTTKKISDILGCAVPKDELVRILAELGIKVEEKGKTLVAIVNEDREDVVGVNDLAEEFIRVYGYKHVKPTLFKYAAQVSGNVPDEIKTVDEIKDILASCGLSEAVTYSFTSPDFADKLGLEENNSARNAIKLLNPIGEALSVMRTTLTHSMLETLAYNITHFNKSAALFEIAKVYLPKSLPLEELPHEEERLVIGAYGDGIDYYSVKNAVDKVLCALGIETKIFRSNRPFLHPGRSAEIVAAGESIGFIGEIHPNTARKYEVENYRINIAELSVEKLCALKKNSKRKFEVFSKFPTIERDLALVVDDSVLAADMIDAVKAADADYLSDVKIFDVFKSEQLGADKKSVGIRLSFSSVERTLTDDEIAVQIEKILASLNSRTGAKIR